MLESTGILICDPEAKSISQSQWWLILQCCPELGKYYRKQILKFIWSKPKNKDYLKKLHCKVFVSSRPNIFEVHKQLGIAIGKYLTPKEVMAWIGLFEIFL